MLPGESYCAFLDCAMGGRDIMEKNERYCCQNRCRADGAEYGSLQSPFFKDYKTKCMEENKLTSYENYEPLMINVNKRITETESQDKILLREIMQVAGPFKGSTTKIIDVVNYENKMGNYYYKIIITDTQNIRQHIIFMRWSNLKEFIEKLKGNYDISDDIDIPPYRVRARTKADLDRRKKEIQDFFDKLLGWSAAHFSQGSTGISGLLNSPPFIELYSKYNYKNYSQISGGSKMKTKKKKYKTKKKKYKTKKKKYKTKKKKYNI